MERNKNGRSGERPFLFPYPLPTKREILSGGNFLALNTTIDTFVSLGILSDNV